MCHRSFSILRTPGLVCQKSRPHWPSPVRSGGRLAAANVERRNCCSLGRAKAVAGHPENQRMKSATCGAKSKSQTLRNNKILDDVFKRPFFGGDHGDILGLGIS